MQALSGAAVGGGQFTYSSEGTVKQWAELAKNFRAWDVTVAIPSQGQELKDSIISPPRFSLCRFRDTWVVDGKVDSRRSRQSRRKVRAHRAHTDSPRTVWRPQSERAAQQVYEHYASTAEVYLRAWHRAEPLGYEGARQIIDPLTGKRAVMTLEEKWRYQADLLRSASWINSGLVSESNSSPITFKPCRRANRRDKSDKFFEAMYLCLLVLDRESFNDHRTHPDDVGYFNSKKDASVLREMAESRKCDTTSGFMGLVARFHLCALLAERYSTKRGTKESPFTEIFLHAT